MFSKDNRHYRPTPRTTQQAFGPYHDFVASQERARNRQFVRDILPAVAGIIAMVIIGLELGWRG